jgi:acetoin utilization protein AcuB
MLVRDRMSTPPITVDANSSIREARALMRHFDIRRVPVVQRGRLVGIVSWTDLMRAQASPASTLSPWEVPVLLAKASVREIMTPDPITIDPDAPIEGAAVIMRREKIGGLPVVKGTDLLGIITESDIFEAFIDLTGLRHGGARLVVDLTDRAGALGEAAAVIEAAGVTLSSLATYEQDSHRMAILRANGPYPMHLADSLREKGFRVVHLTNAPPMALNGSVTGQTRGTPPKHAAASPAPSPQNPQ